MKERTVPSCADSKFKYLENVWTCCVPFFAFSRCSNWGIVPECQEMAMRKKLGRLGAFLGIMLFVSAAAHAYTDCLECKQACDD